MKILFAHLRFRFLLTMKHPAFIVSTIVFPSLFFMIFARPNANTIPAANMLLASFTGFSLLSVIFLMFSVQTSHDQSSHWQQYLLTLPISKAPLIFANVLNCFIFVFLAALAVFVGVKYSTEIDLNAATVFRLYFVLILASPPFIFLATILGMTLSTQSILPTTNLVYLLLSFMGGLWMPPNALPLWVQDISKYLPSRHLGELLWATVAGESLPTHSIYALLIYTFVTGLCATAILVRRLETSS